MTSSDPSRAASAASPGSSVAQRRAEQVPRPHPDVLSRSYHLPSYPLAVAFVTSVAEAAEVANHHPNLSIVHSCTEGVDVGVELFTYAVTGLTAFDTAAAEGIEQIYRDHGGVLDVS